MTAHLININNFMRSLFKNTIITLSLSALIMCLLDIISYVLINSEKPKGLNFTIIDPLLGWSSSEISSNLSKLPMESNSILLINDKNNCDSSVIIYLSGGSTTDLMFDENNWPIFLSEKMKKEGVCFKIYAAAVSGYNTGQEYLKLIRDYEDIMPDIHISYNGANEGEYPSYVSLYEEGFYQENILYNLLMPNFFKLLIRKNLIKIENKNLYNKMFEPHDFWIKNNLLMKSHADLYKYKFFSILQPVRGFSGQKMDKNKEQFKDDFFYHNLVQFENFYPKAIETASKHEFIIDLTKFFSSEEKEVFKDDCHLNKGFQEGLAEEILSKIKTQ